MRCAYQNVRGLRTKSTEFFNNVASSKFDIIAISETWATESIFSSELFPSDYLVYRKDRCLTNSRVSRGGGVLLAVDTSLRSSALNFSSVTEKIPIIDIVGVKLIVKHHGAIFIIVVYIPPAISFDHMELFFEAFNSWSNFSDSDDVVILGDFNVSGFMDGSTDNFSILLNNFQEFQNLQQYNRLRNYYNRILDLVFSKNMTCDVSLLLSPFVKEDRHHPSLHISLPLKKGAVSYFYMNKQSECFNFKKANFQRMYDLFLHTDWSTLYKTVVVDDACLIFYELLNGIFEETVPKSRIKSKRRRYPPWFNPEIISALKNKQIAFKQYKILKTIEAYEEFKFYRSYCKQAICNSYKEYISNIENDLHHDPKRFWGFIQNKKGTSRIPASMNYINQNLEEPNLIVNAFADYFNSVYVPSNSCINTDDFNFSNSGCVSLPHISDDDVLGALKSAKNTFTMGPDGIPSFLLKDCAIAFVEPLKYLFNLILKTSTFPTMWKSATICPVLKKGDKSDIMNYRPISLLCNFSKIFETLLYKYIYSAVKPYISPLQHGFCEKRSTMTNLVCFAQFTAEAINDRKQVDTVYLDFQKAFDQIDHCILLQKLKSFGFVDSLINLFESYLLNRNQCVRYRCYTSKYIYPSSGVPQGSNLGPLLFLLFVNDITNVVSSDGLLFADDYKVYKCISSIKDCVDLQEDLDKLSQWCQRNRLFLNLLKCVVISYSRKHTPIYFQYNINNTNLKRNDTVTDLGILFDAKFTFVAHINNIVAKAQKTYGFIYRNGKDFTKIQTLKTLFFALVRSQLEYGSLIWNPVYQVHIKHIESVQRSFLKFLSFCEDGVYPPRGFNHIQLLNKFYINSLQTRRIISGVRFIIHLINYKIDCMWLLGKLNFLIPKYNSRQHNAFYCPPCYSNTLVKSPVVSSCKACNRILHYCDLTDNISIITKKIVTIYGT